MSNSAHIWQIEACKPADASVCGSRVSKSRPRGTLSRGKFAFLRAGHLELFAQKADHLLRLHDAHHAALRIDDG
jgi:hypothetical protein